jgi:predicted metal-binding membrane protein
VSARTDLRERWAVLGGLAGITAAAWIYLVVESRRMSMGAADHAMGTMGSVVHLPTWTVAEFDLRLVMWAVMMIAMMVPTAAPMTLVYAAVARKAAHQDNPVAPTFVFVTGYLSMWGVFSVAATVTQLSLDKLALLSPTMVVASPWLGGGLLVAAGVYELSPYKRACLEHCRAPAHFISQHWRGGPAGAFRMGVELGAYCVGCCWVLMALLFVGGAMNLVWIAAIAAFVLLEKTVPFARSTGRAVGAALILVGMVALTGIVALA